MPPLLPPIRDTAELDRLRADEHLWRPAMTEIARRHDLPAHTSLFSTGSAIVFAAGSQHVVKLHEPWHRDLYENEVACLRLVQNRLPVAAPEVLATGELEGWAYLVMSRLAGAPLGEVRDRLAPADLVSIAEQVAILARALHELAVPRDFHPFQPWNAFLTAQRANCVERHRGNGVPEPLLASLEAQLADAALELDVPVFLHTELTDTNLMVERKAGRWRLCGVFDFEPSMLGHPLYDLPAITIFVARGEPEACRAGLRAFGLRELDDGLRSRLLACTLLHRYSHIEFFLRQVGVLDQPRQWSEVARALLGF